MPLDGAGKYQPPTPEYPVVPGTVILAEDFNTIVQDFATTLSQAIFRDGQANFTADQSMGGFKLLGLQDGSAPADAVNFKQVFVDPAFSATTVEGVKVQGTALTVKVADILLTALNTLNLSKSALVLLPENTGLGSSTDKVASIPYVHSVAMNAALPAQDESTVGKVPVSDGTNAYWGGVIGNTLYLFSYAGGF